MGVRRATTAVVVVLVLGGCSDAGARSGGAPSSRSILPPTTTTVPAPPPSSTTVPPVVLVDWTGPVEHLFFHTLVIRPELAFTHDGLAKGFRDYFVTVGEFRAILDQLYANGWTLVDLHRVIAGAVRVPFGRKPLVLSEDDVNYYDYSRPRGQGWRLVLDTSGQVKVEVRDDLGPRTTDEDLVPIVDAFVALHPDFSAEGAKGVLALTGYQGVFGERVNRPNTPDLADAVNRASAIAARLKATGWILANHSYGHIDLSKESTARAQRDAERWKAETVPIIGDTDVYIYPFGASPGSTTLHMLRDEGYTIQCNIDPVARLSQVDGVSVMSRRHIDGIAFAQQPRSLAPFFDVATVEDVAARAR